MAIIGGTLFSDTANWNYWTDSTDWTVSNRLTSGFWFHWFHSRSWELWARWDLPCQVRGAGWKSSRLEAPGRQSSRSQWQYYWPPAISALCQTHQVIPEISPQNHLHLISSPSRIPSIVYQHVPTCTNMTGQIPKLHNAKCLEVQDLKVPWVAAAALQCWGWTSAFKASGDNVWQWYGSGSKPCTPGAHQNSWDLWMFIPLKMVLIGIDGIDP